MQSTHSKLAAAPGAAGQQLDGIEARFKKFRDCETERDQVGVLQDNCTSTIASV